MNATKFRFDTVFADEHGFVADTDRGPKRRSLSDSEIDDLCAAARAEGRTAGEILAAEAIASGTRDAAAAVEKALGLMTRERRVLRSEAAAIALAVARKLAHAAMSAWPAADVEAALRDAMHQAIGEPRIVLRAAPVVIDALASRIADIAQEEAYEGRVQTTADPALQRADCRIEWRGGGAERAEQSIDAALELMIARHFGGGISHGDE
jgi:flagellar assembly protein FliH